MSPCDILARRTRLAFLNSTAARLTLPRVVELMGARLGWDAARQRVEIEAAEAILARDFAGPVPNKSCAYLRSATTADVKDIFDKLDSEKRGVLSKEKLRKASTELGFPLGDAELDAAMSEMDRRQTGEVNFPEFLEWWNSCSQSADLYTKMSVGSRAMTLHPDHPARH